MDHGKVVFPAHAGVYRCRRLSPIRECVSFPANAGVLPESLAAAIWRCLVPRMTVSYRECGGSPFFLGQGFPLPSVEGVAPKMGFAYPTAPSRPRGGTMGFAYRPTRPVSFRKSLSKPRNPVNDGICLPNDGIYLSPNPGAQNESGFRF